VPTILGFDPRCQFIGDDDMANGLEHAVRYDLDGVYNCAADGVLALSEVVDLLGKRSIGVLPPWGTGPAAAVARRLGVPIQPDLLPQLRFGRALDNRRYKATGFRYSATTRETVLRLRAQQRLAPIVGGDRSGGAYRYEAAVEEFLRFSPSVRQPNVRPSLPRANTAPVQRPLADPSGVSALTAREILTLLPSLTPEDLRALRAHEAAHAQRASVLAAIDRLLARATADS
jgi:UDP-glucose 4-epimerase